MPCEGRKEGREGGREAGRRRKAFKKEAIKIGICGPCSVGLAGRAGRISSPSVCTCLLISHQDKGETETAPFSGTGSRLRGLKRHSHFSLCFCSHGIIDHTCSRFSPLAFPSPSSLTLQVEEKHVDRRHLAGVTVERAVSPRKGVDLRSVFTRPRGWASKSR